MVNAILESTYSRGLSGDMSRWALTAEIQAPAWRCVIASWVKHPRTSGSGLGFAEFDPAGHDAH